MWCEIVFLRTLVNDVEKNICIIFLERFLDSSVKKYFSILLPIMSNSLMGGDYFFEGGAMTKKQKKITSIFVNWFLVSIFLGDLLYFYKEQSSLFSVFYYWLLATQLWLCLYFGNLLIANFICECRNYMVYSNNVIFVYV